MRVQYVIALAVAAALLAPASMSLQAQGTPAPAPAPVLKKSAPPLRGQAELGFVQTAKLEGDTIVTTFQVKNMSASNAIVGLQISEFWYDKAGNPLQGTGDRQRLRSPLQPLDVATHHPEVAEGRGHDDPAVQVRAEQRDRQAGVDEGRENAEAGTGQLA